MKRPDMSIKDLLSSMEMCEKLGEKHNGYIDVKVCEYFECR